MAKMVTVCIPEFETDKKIEQKITIMFWFKNEGQDVQEGEELVEVQTDKAILDIESPTSGKLNKIIANAGQEVSPGQKIGEIERG
nr:lipoyl domain-containing protein [Candidatus Omnitrophota bacterium]